MNRNRNSIIMAGSIAHNDGAIANADTALENMGYKSELPRSLSMMSILGLYVSSRAP